MWLISILLFSKKESLLTESIITRKKTWKLDIQVFQSQFILYYRPWFAEVLSVWEMFVWASSNLRLILVTVSVTGIIYIIAVLFTIFLNDILRCHSLHLLQDLVQVSEYMFA